MNVKKELEELKKNLNIFDFEAKEHYEITREAEYVVMRRMRHLIERVVLDEFYKKNDIDFEKFLENNYEIGETKKLIDLFEKLLANDEISKDKDEKFKNEILYAIEKYNAETNKVKEKVVPILEEMRKNSLLDENFDNEKFKKLRAEFHALKDEYEANHE